MHLRDARVDLSGQLIAIGHLDYPRDDEGIFALPVHDSISIDVRSEYGPSFTPVVSERDAASGFLKSSKVGPTFSVPPAIGSAILGTLRADEPTSIRLQSFDQGGKLMLFLPGQLKTQLLSDWTLQIDVDDGFVFVRLTAALLMTRPPQMSESNHWTTHKDAPARLNVEFKVDSVTRTTLFDVPLTSRLEEPASPESDWARDLTAKSHLEAASIDQRGNVYGITPDGRALRLDGLRDVGGHMTSLTYCRGLRLANGFLAGPARGYIDYPRIWLHTLNIAAITRLLEERTPSIDFSGGYFGYLQQHREYHLDHTPPPSQSIIQTTFRPRVDATGLTVNYRLFVTDLVVAGGSPYKSGWIEGAFTLPWALLVLRFPAPFLLKHRPRVDSEFS